MSQHAILSPSAASRWLACPPSARLEQKFPDKKSDAAEEGTLAHSLGELLIKHKLNRMSKTYYNKQLNAIQESSFYDNAMHQHADDYATFVIERYAEAQAHTGDAQLFLEQKLDLTDYIKEGFGTGDTVIIANTVLDLIDLKYGKGVPVYAHENKQLMLYALGALRDHDFLFDIETVRMTIYQPRLDNISTFEMSVTDLRKWAEDELIPKAALAFEGQGEYLPGTHCRFCRASATCKANASYNLEIAKYDFMQENLLSDTEIADILDRADSFIKWIAAVEDHALSEAVNNGKKWPGYKLVEGRSNRQYTDENKVIETLKEHAFNEDVLFAPRKILGITEMEKFLTKKLFNSYLSELVIKPQGKPTLVQVTDKRPEYNSIECAINDFQEN